MGSLDSSFHQHTTDRQIRDILTIGAFQEIPGTLGSNSGAGASADSVVDTAWVGIKRDPTLSERDILAALSTLNELQDKPRLYLSLSNIPFVTEEFVGVLMKLSKNLDLTLVDVSKQILDKLDRTIPGYFRTFSKATDLPDLEFSAAALSPNDTELRSVIFGNAESSRRAAFEAQRNSCHDRRTSAPELKLSGPLLTGLEQDGQMTIVVSPSVGILSDGTRIMRQFSAELKLLVSQSGGAINVDLSQVTFMGAEGIGVLIAAAKSCKDANREFNLCNLTPTVLQKMKAIGMESLLTLPKD